MAVSAPNPENYDAWYAAREARTQIVLDTKQAIRGTDVRKQNLSQKMIYEAGYTLSSGDVFVPPEAE